MWLSMPFDNGADDSRIWCGRKAGSEVGLGPLPETIKLIIMSVIATEKPSDHRKP
jgi:hypothetical protein